MNSPGFAATGPSALGVVGPAPARTSAATARREPGAEHWLANTRLLMLDDPCLRFRAQALMQQRATEPERLLAIQAYVKSLEFVIPRQRVLTARQVAEGRGNGWFGKSTLFVALLRIAGFPARIRLLQFSPELFRGYLQSTGPFSLPVVEVWSQGRWLQTDSHVYDREYLTLARRALQRREWRRGFGIDAWGSLAWSGRDDALVMAGMPQSSGPSVVADLGTYSDPDEFMPVLVERDAAWFAQKSRFYWRKSRLRAGIGHLRDGQFD